MFAAVVCCKVGKGISRRRFESIKLNELKYDLRVEIEAQKIKLLSAGS